MLFYYILSTMEIKQKVRAVASVVSYTILKECLI